MAVDGDTYTIKINSTATSTYSIPTAATGDIDGGILYYLLNPGGNVSFSPTVGWGDGRLNSSCKRVFTGES